MSKAASGAFRAVHPFASELGFGVSCFSSRTSSGKLSATYITAAVTTAALDPSSISRTLQGFLSGIGFLGGPSSDRGACRLCFQWRSAPSRQYLSLCDDPVFEPEAGTEKTCRYQPQDDVENFGRHRPS